MTRSTLCLNLTACALIRSKSSDSFRTSTRQSPGGGHAAFRTEEGAAGSGKVDESSAEATVATAAAAAAADGDDADDDDDDDDDGDEDAVGVAVVVAVAVAAESPPPLPAIAVGSSIIFGNFFVEEEDDPSVADGEQESAPDAAEDGDRDRERDRDLE